ncbi:MAG: hypothetical protein QM831_12135 [Kofleriaceae bacterium]
MSELQPTEVLYIPKRKRLTHARLPADDGAEILHLFYGETELVFDEPDVAPLGEKLLVTEQFAAGDAMAWSNAEPHSWDKIRELLESLLEVKVLARVADAPTGKAKETYPQHLGDPQPREAETFSAAAASRCPHLTEQAFGRAFEIENLEVLVPIYRIAHPAMDADGRQIGENNVTPRTLFLDLPTQRKLCGYPGSRYQHELPMNQTAMKHMSKRWPELMSLTEQFRLALHQRLPLRAAPAFTAGELHWLAVCTLASVGYVMVRGNDPVPNGQLDGGLAAMFRLIDGVRLVTNDLVRSDVDAKGCDVPVTAQSIAAYADRHDVYRGTHGVCAGPPALIDEYLRVLMGEEAAPIQIEPNVSERLGNIEAAIDYGLIGQRIESVVRYLGASEGLLHERLRAAVADHPASALKAAIDAPIDLAHYPQLRTDFPPDETFRRELDLSRWLWNRAGEALPGKVVAKSLEQLATLDPAEQDVTRRRLAEILDPAIAAIAAEAFALERRCIRVIDREQAALNKAIGRAQGRGLTNIDLATYTRPRNGPPMFETLAAAGIEVISDATSTTVKRGDQTLTITE